MAKAGDEREEYVVELTVAGVAVVTVRGHSSHDACQQAEQAVRPVDVTELDRVAALRVVKVSDPAVEGGRPPGSRARGSVSKGRDHARQA